MRPYRYSAAALVVACAVLLRLWVFLALDGLLPQEGLYVDEKTYSMSPFVPGIEGFSRPPGMFLLSMTLNTGENVILSRAFISLLSILPALALYLAGGKDRAGAVLAAGLALSPFMALYGLALMPAVPAAVLVSFALLAAVRERSALSGFLTGTAILFRAELVIVPAVLLIISTGRFMKKWTVFTAMASLAVLPVVAVNILAGAGPVIAANGGENLWIGTSWERISTPPGTEFEELVSTGTSRSRGDTVFFRRAVREICSDPGRWAGMGMVKSAAYFGLPGPGRNIETGWLMGKTHLLLLLPLTLAAMSLGISGAFEGKTDFWQALAVSVATAGLISSFIFFPSARFRTATLPAFWFLALSAIRNRRAIVRSLVPAVMTVIISVLLTYPGKERSGLTSILAAEHMLTRGDLERSMEYLREASDRGYHGADLHNIMGAALSMSGLRRQGLHEFRLALEQAPDSPALWKNYAVSLWSNGMYGESVDAARRAVYLNPLLRGELGPILEHGDGM